MNADRIHAQLDAATRDTSVSVDAMRCGPAPEGETAEDGMRAEYAAAIDGDPGGCHLLAAERIVRTRP